MPDPAHDQRSSRQRLIDAAREVFLERGYAGVTVGAIARKAGFTTGALYGHFQSKEELLSVAVAQAISDDVRDALERALPGRSASDAAHKLLVDVLSRPLEPGDVLVMHGLAGVLGDGQDVLRPQLVRIVEVIRALVERGMADGVIDPAIDVDALLHVVAALYFGSVALRMLNMPVPARGELAGVVDRFQEVFAPVERLVDGEAPPPADLPAGASG